MAGDIGATDFVFVNDVEFFGLVEECFDDDSDFALRAGADHTGLVMLAAFGGGDGRDPGCYFCSFNFPTCGVSEDGLDVFPRSNVTSFGVFCASLF